MKNARLPKHLTRVRKESGNEREKEVAETFEPHAGPCQ